MSEQYLHVCDCGREFRSSVPAPPPGWVVEDGKATCDECLEAPNAVARALGFRDDQLRSDLRRSFTAIRLRSGSFLDLDDPDCGVVQPIDIASGLRQARFTAQTSQFFTIAQHSVLVRKLVEPRAKIAGGERGNQLRKCALMHDAAEAFIHDITRPLKIMLPDYRRVEAVLERRLFAQFGIEWTAGRKEIVKAADIAALAIETRDLADDDQNWRDLSDVERAQLNGIKIARAWHPDEAQDHFLREFDALFPSTDERKAA